MVGHGRGVVGRATVRAACAGALTVAIVGVVVSSGVSCGPRRAYQEEKIERQGTFEISVDATAPEMAAFFGRAVRAFTAKSGITVAVFPPLEGGRYIVVAAGRWEVVITKERGGRALTCVASFQKQGGQIRVVDCELSYAGDEEIFYVDLERERCASPQVKPPVAARRSPWTAGFIAWDRLAIQRFIGQRLGPITGSSMFCVGTGR